MRIARPDCLRSDFDDKETVRQCALRCPVSFSNDQLCVHTNAGLIADFASLSRFLPFVFKKVLEGEGVINLIRRGL